jgi:hypothetical protein
MLFPDDIDHLRDVHQTTAGICATMPRLTIVGTLFCDNHHVWPRHRFDKLSVVPRLKGIGETCRGFRDRRTGERVNGSRGEG